MYVIGLPICVIFDDVRQAATTLGLDNVIETESLAQLALVGKGMSLVHMPSGLALRHVRRWLPNKIMKNCGIICEKKKEGYYTYLSI